MASTENFLDSIRFQENSTPKKQFFDKEESLKMVSN